MKSFLKQRIALAKALAAGVSGGHYVDAGLITTAVISACASMRWPGRRIDRKRFIQLLVADSPAELHTTWVSVPALINEGLVSVQDTPYAGGNSDRIFCGHEVDLNIAVARARYRGVPELQLRKHSYAAVIYERLRCGYAHEYWHHSTITHVPPSRRAARVSYIGRIEGRGVRRMACFRLDYLSQLAEHHVSLLPREPTSLPGTWWIEGG